MTDPDPRSAQEAHWTELERTAEIMWHEIFAATVLELLAENRSVTVPALREALERRMTETGIDRLTQAKCRGALRQLD